MFSSVPKPVRLTWPIGVTSILLSLLVSSCIPVGDLGVYWEKGVLDPRLEGHWKKAGAEFRSQDQYVSFFVDGESYKCVLKHADEPPAPANVPEHRIEVRTLAIGKYRFLMLRMEMPAMPGSAPVGSDPVDQADKTASGLIRYAVENDQLVAYALKEHVPPEAIKAGTVKGKSPGSTGDSDLTVASISRLDQRVIDAISEWSDDLSKWKVQGRYDRVNDIDKALAESRSYPATPQTAASTTVDINLPNLKYLAEEEGQVLLRQLSASPEWEVLDEFGDVACYKRGYYAGFESNSDTSPSEDERYQIRYLFRFGRKPGGRAHWGSSLLKVGPLAGSTKLNLKSSDQGIESYVCIGQEGLWFEFFEQTHVEERRHTREALDWVRGFLADVRKAEEEIRRTGHAAKLLPSGSVRRREPSMEIEQVHGGRYRVRAWVNPGAAGRAYMKFFDNKSNTPFARGSAPEEPVFARANSRIGWSTDPSTLFGYDVHVFVRDEDSEKTYDARIELWFKNDKTGEESKLIERSHELLARKPDPGGR